MTDFTFVDAGIRQVLEAMPDAVLLVDHHGTIRFANQVTEQVFGYARNDLLGSPIEVLIPERFRQRHVDQRQAYADDPHRREMGSGLGLVGRRRDGAEFPVDISLSPFETAAGALVCAILRDMTQHRQQEEALRASEERFALAVRGSSDGIRGLE